ncbi:germin-like protein subfamily 1 member 11 [Diospyros lotus]|uniref:germin-like protein subfamily 1 member 11 n=1 Tax=Diospyros lotus TaxID=55363 RepID=UPI002258EE72|nr:germin-like protein subfamily 1 member 11 [Diospyros lotus]
MTMVTTIRRFLNFQVAAAAMSIFMALVSDLAYATDPNPLQNFCVAINQSTVPNAVFVNGKFCKDPKVAKPEDFSFSGLLTPRNTSNPLGSTITLVNVDKLPGINTLGISMSRIDYAPNGGVNPPHEHPRASEILLVLEGTLYVGFVTTNPDNRLFSKILRPGDMFVFPMGLIHFQLNVGKSRAVAIAAFNSQNPGLVTIANGLFGSNPRIDPSVLTRAFQLDEEVVDYLLTRVWYINLMK